MYNVKYTGNGQIEVDLPSYPSGVIIKHGDYARLNLTAVDLRVIKSLKSLGLSYEESDEKKGTVKAPLLQVDPEADTAPEVEESEEVQILTKEDLMRKTAGDLKGMLKALGVEEIENKSKSAMSDQILEIMNASENE